MWGTIQVLYIAQTTAVFNFKTLFNYGQNVLVFCTLSIERVGPMHIEVFKCRPMFLLQLCKFRSHKIKIVYPILDYTELLQLSLKQGR